MTLADRTRAARLPDLRLRCDAPAAAARAAAAACRRDPGRGTVRLLAAGPLRGHRARLRPAAGPRAPAAARDRAGRVGRADPDPARRPLRRHHVGHVHHAEAGGPGRVRRALPHDRAPGRRPQRGRRALADTGSAAPNVTANRGQGRDHRRRVRSPAPSQRKHRRLSAVPRCDHRADRIPHRRVRRRCAGDRGGRRAEHGEAGRLSARRRRAIAGGAFHPEDEDLRRFANSSSSAGEPTAPFAMLDTWSKRPK